MTPGRFSTPPIAPEDDWFAESDDRPSAGRDERRLPADSTIESEGSAQESRRMRRPGGQRDRRILAAVIAGAFVLLVGGILVARAFTGADGGGATTTPALQTTTSTPTTTPTTTTPTTTTPTTSTPTTTTPSASSTATLPEGVRLSSGDESEAVSQVQAALVELGYSTGGVDGKFGPATEQAVRDFQTDSGLDVDGVVGPATLAALSAALDEQ